MRAALKALVVAAALTGARAWAGACTADGLIVFPAPGAVIPTNAEFILEGTGSEQARVSDLVGQDKLLLKAYGDEVAVKVERGWISPMRRVAVRLRPAKPLKPNLEYTLLGERALEGAKVLNDVLGENLLRWTTGGGPDKASPKFVSKPGVAEGFYDKAKDGALTRWIKLRTDVEENGPVYLLVTMQRARGSSVKQIYPVPVAGGHALMGHDACSGAFGFDDGRAYKLQLVLYDCAGNKSADKVSLELSAPRSTVPVP